jgi:hypothetical protein
MQVALFPIVMAGMETIFSNLRKVEPDTSWGESRSAKRQRGEGAGIRHPHTVTKSLDQKPIPI